MKPHLNTLVLAFTIVITMIAGILFGLAPAFSAGRADLATSLKAGVRSDHVSCLLMPTVATPPT